MRVASTTASPTSAPSWCSTSPSVMMMRIATRSCPLLFERRSSSCMVIAASAAAVTLGKTIQNPSPSGLTIRPSCATETRVIISLCAASSAVRSCAESARNSAVEPPMSVFRIARRAQAAHRRPQHKSQARSSEGPPSEPLGGRAQPTAASADQLRAGREPRVARYRELAAERGSGDDLGGEDVVAFRLHTFRYPVHQVSDGRLLFRDGEPAVIVVADCLLHEQIGRAL